MIGATATEIETVDTDIAMTAERDRMTVMGMMTLANEGISLRLHLVCWVGPFDFSISAFQLFSPFPRVRRATFFSVSTSPWVSWSICDTFTHRICPRTATIYRIWLLASPFRDAIKVLQTACRQHTFQGFIRGGNSQGRLCYSHVFF